jgi:hypothetical protein
MKVRAILLNCLKLGFTRFGRANRQERFRPDHPKRLKMDLTHQAHAEGLKFLDLGQIVTESGLLFSVGPQLR